MKKYYWLLVVIGIAGCTSASYNPTTGMKYSNWIFQKHFSELTVNTNGTLSIKGYESEAAGIAKAVANAVANGLGKAVVP